MMAFIYGVAARQRLVYTLLHNKILRHKCGAVSLHKCLFLHLYVYEWQYYTRQLSLRVSLPAHILAFYCFA